MKKWLDSLWEAAGGHPQGRGWRRLIFPLSLALLCAPLGRALFLWAGRAPERVEAVYSGKIYPVLSHAVDRLTGWIPFSLAEWLLYGLIAGLLALFVVQGIRLFTRPHPIYRFCRVMSGLLAVSSVSYLLFYGLWGLQYQRLPLADILGYDTAQAADAETLEGLCRALIERTNEAAARTARQADGTLQCAGTPQQVLQGAVAAWSALGEQVPALASRPYGPPKAVAASVGLCYANITGIFIPYTMEANVNIMTPACLLPSTAAHEAAHQRGFAREDEANYLSFLACRASGMPDYVYSGYLLASIYAMNALYTVDREAYARLLPLFSAPVAADLRENSAFWDQYEGPVADASTASNDAFLRGNLQEAGVNSYGRMVDLLVAEYRVNPLMEAPQP